MHQNKKRKQKLWVQKHWAVFLEAVRGSSGSPSTRRCSACPRRAAARGCQAHHPRAGSRAQQWLLLPLLPQPRIRIIRQPLLPAQPRSRAMDLAQDACCHRSRSSCSPRARHRAPEPCEPPLPSHWFCNGSRNWENGDLVAARSPRQPLFF